MFSLGITHEEMVQESKRHWQRLEQNAQKQPKVRRADSTRASGKQAAQLPPSV